MFQYATLSPNRKQFVDLAKKTFPDLSTTITKDQIQQVVDLNGINYPQWFIVKDNREGRGIYKFPAISLANTVEAIPETVDEIKTRIRETFEALQDLTQAVAANTVNALIVTGAPGLGKSFTVNKVLHDINDGEYGYVFHSGYLRASHLFRLLWENRQKGQVVVIDDCDGILSDEIALNILKSALELKPVRRVGWGSEKEFEDQDGEQIPRYFNYEGSVIFLTNKPIRQMIAANDKASPHLAALESRGLILDLKIRTRQEYLIKIEQTLAEGLLRNQGISQHAEKEIMQFINDHLDNFTELSLRMVEKIARLFVASPKSWQKIVKATCWK
jgi:hypothetical protein